MRRDILTSAIAALVFMVLLGLVYPLVITGVSQVAFPGNANGQQVHLDGKLVGSRIIGQSFSVPKLKNGKVLEEKGVVVTEPDPRYFQSRPSATEGGAYNAAASTFSNLGPNSKATEEAIAEHIKSYIELEGPYNPGLTRRARAGRRGQQLRLEPRPRNLPGERSRPGASRGGGAAPVADGPRRPRRPVHRRARDRILGRGRRKRARAQPSPRSAHGGALMSAQTPQAPERQRTAGTQERQAISLFQRDIVWRALLDSFKKLDPRVQVRNPVMFVVEIGSVITTVTWLIQAFGGKPLGGGNEPSWYTFVIALWLWLTVVFANMAEAFAEGRGRAQADTLRAMRKETVAKMRDGSTKAAAELTRGDVVIVPAGELIPGDGTVIEGIATVDESAITGESAPVIRESGGDRSAVTGGTRVTSDRIVVEITQEPGKSFLDRMIALVEGAERRKTPNEIALNILLAALTLIFMIVVATLRPFGLFAHTPISETTLIALLVALIPTTIGALLSAIGIAGMDRLVRRNVLALSGRAVEASGDVDVLLLDKTGTITIGNRLASEFVPMPGVAESELAEVAQLSSLADETPEGRSIVVLAKQYGIREHDMATLHADFVPFTAQTRMSGVDIDGRRLRKGAGDAIVELVRSEGGSPPPELQAQLDRIGREGGTPLAVARDSQVLGVIYLKDTIKEGMRVRFDHLRAMGIKTVMVTGDNRLTAAKIAEESGVDDFLSEATPEAKLALIREQQGDGRLVAMTGDGTNDAPALAQADVGVAMNTGTQAAREAGNMVDLDSNPTKLIEIVEVGKQLLITRGALTTFSIANDVAKYFAILPAIFVTTWAASPGGKSPLHVLNVMGLGSPAQRDRLGDHLQRARDPAADPARAARRALPADRRERAAASQPPDLRPRRHHRAVHRHQADRPGRPQPPRRMSEAIAAAEPASRHERLAAAVV